MSAPTTPKGFNYLQQTADLEKRHGVTVRWVCRRTPTPELFHAIATRRADSLVVARSVGSNPEQALRVLEKLLAP